MSSEYRKNYDAIKWPEIKAKSRSELREHEKKHNVRQIGNDWAGSERPSNWDTMRNVNN